MGSSTSRKIMLGVFGIQKLPDDWEAAIYKEFKDIPYLGLYGMLGGDRRILVNDIELIKKIMIKDFDHFVDRRKFDIAPTGSNKYIVEMLTSLKGDQWKHVRSLISPVFTSGKLKGMVPLIHKVAGEMVEHLHSMEGEDFESKIMMTNFTLDV